MPCFTAGPSQAESRKETRMQRETRLQHGKLLPLEVNADADWNGDSSVEQSDALANG